ncbi:valine--tRNA ligase [Mycoplasma sp. P36-A1]|uniref:valine--tRNA ligase n=1 Tax=Mycoplasma sp. P36-A1 TaxID=3252900 RepID=UPI003C2B55C2
MRKINDKYNHLQVEEHKNQNWIDKKYFSTNDLSKEPFTIVIPPPNVTGKLHLGHAWDTTLQDVLIRYKKMKGFDTVWVSGMDHAGISTQAKVDQRLRQQGTSFRELGREKFLEKAWEWKDEYAATIKEQWGKLGLGLDYQRERFTLDSGLNDAVTKVFVDLYNKGYIYRGKRIINWDPAAQTALSNIEVIHEDVAGFEHYFKYEFSDGSGKFLEVMTTRPETIFGDGAIAVHPKDERYTNYIGKEVYTPVSHIAIPIITDEYVDMEVGSGCVKITPAHDPNDFEVGKRHDVPIKIILNDDASMASNEWVPKKFQGLDRFECRKQFIEASKEEGTFIKMDSIIHSVGHSERSGAVVEPLLSLQWFVAMDKLSQAATDYQSTSDKINFVPERFEKTFLQWMEKVEDWTISRQLWWGHRIPAWYHNETKEVYVGINPPQDIENYSQDEDVLDTWFSSGLWPFSTLGWPEKTPDLDRYFPTSVLVTGYDIIFFWVSRMIFMSHEFLDDKPFEDVLIHGLVRDSEGRKMSKSLGNGVDPMDVIDKYGADSLRFFLTTNSSPGQDLRYTEEKVEATKNFINKLWNAARFVMMNIEDTTTDVFAISDLLPADKWILKRLNETIQEVTLNMEKYEFTIVGSSLYSFIWDDYCSWYIEMSKATMELETTKSVHKYVLEAILKMLNPFMPFVTEEIYTALTGEETIVTTNYPEENNDYNFDTTSAQDAMELITMFREIRKEYEIKRAIKINYEIDKDLSQANEYIEKMINFTKGISDQASRIETYITKDGTTVAVDLSMVEEKSNEEVIAEYQVELEQLTKEISRAKGMLSNEKFISKAPAAKVAEEKDKLATYQAKYDSIQAIVDQLK